MLGDHDTDVIGVDPSRLRCSAFVAPPGCPRHLPDFFVRFRGSPDTVRKAELHPNWTSGDQANNVRIESGRLFGPAPGQPLKTPA